MMKIMRILLFPIAILYGLIVGLRNFLFDVNFLKSFEFDIPIICVGNLNVGGTGKSPQIEYLIRLLSDKYNVATLSRGYKRESKGFLLANDDSNAKILGDEPFQFYSKFKKILVSVDAVRKNGIENLLSLPQKPDVILLDDAFQHRKVKAGFYILLTSYNDLYCDDFILPTGNLRESRSGSQRANLIIVTKCPKNLSEIEQEKIRKKLNISSNQDLFFSFIDYDEQIYSELNTLNISEIINQEKVLLAGIANPKPFFEFLKSSNDIVLEYPDHYNFNKNDVEKIKKLSENKKIITTEKDYVRLKSENIKNLYYLPIKSSFLNQSKQFDDLILDFISKRI